MLHSILKDKDIDLEKNEISSNRSIKGHIINGEGSWNIDIGCLDIKM